jgi:uncharacterized paraquat-inducible protein A
MPYTRCPSCNLTVDTPRFASGLLNHCPRCDSELRAAAPPVTLLSRQAATTPLPSRRLHRVHT